MNAYYTVISVHIHFRIQSRLEGTEVVNKLRSKISHACNSVVRILITTRTKQLHGKSCNLENFELLITFCFSWFFFCNNRELCYFSNHITFSSRRKNLEWDGETDKCCWWSWPKWNNKTCNADESLSFPCSFFSLMVNLGPEVSNRVNCACIQFPAARCTRHFIRVWLMLQFPDLDLIKRK